MLTFLFVVSDQLIVTLLLGIIIVDLVFIVVIVIHFVNAPQKICTKWNYL